MKKTKRFSSLARQHLFRSEILRYVLLLFLPLFLSIALFFSVWSVITRQMNQDGTAVATHFQARTDSVLRETEIVSNAILNDGKFLEYIESASFDPSDLCELMDRKVLDSPYVSSAYLFWEEQGAIYSNQAIFSYSAVPTFMGFLNPTVYDDLDRYFTDAANLSPGWHVAPSGYSSPYYVSDISNGAKLVVTSDIRVFLETIYEPHAVFCCAFNDNASFSSLVFTLPDVNWYSSQEVSTLAKTPVKCFYVEGSNLTYMAAISTNEYYAPLGIILSVFLIYFIVVLIGGYLYLHAVARRRYETAMAFLRALPGSTIENPTYQDVTAVANNTLLQFQENHDFAQRVRNREMLSGLLTSTMPPLAEETAIAGIFPSNNGYYVVRFSVMRFSGNGPDRSRDGVDLMCQILEATLNTLAEKRISATAAAISPHYCVVISILDSMFAEEDLMGTLQNLLDILDESHGILLQAVVSARRKSTTELAQAQEETDRLFSFVHSVDSRTRLVSQTTMQTDAGVLLNGDFLNQQQLLSRALTLEKYDMIPQLVSSILAEHVTALRKHYELATDRLNAVSGLLSESIWSTKYASQEERKQFTVLLRSCRSISDLNSAVQTVFNILAERQRDASIDPVVQQACDYISKNLSDINLSVPQICEAVGISASYFSRVFKHDMNTTIMDYINSRRIELAKQLLLNGNDTMVLIAEASGFGNTVTFSRNFKRYTGMTPNEYRNMNQ